jgi:IPT/TIG domain/Regulator of chromosome condensation (RCC1) repeat
MAWGENHDGQLGDGGGADQDEAVKVRGLPEGAAAIAGGGNFGLALLGDGSVMAWGANEDGQLGDATDTGPETCTNAATPCSTSPVAAVNVNECALIAAWQFDSMAWITPPEPQVLSMQPSEGPARGGTPVTITGSGSIGTTEVTFGSSPAASFKVVSEFEITAVTPPGSGAVEVTVAGPAGSSHSRPSEVFRNGPTVTSVEPSSGPPSGGAAVVIRGTNFNEVTGVTFGATAATSFEVSSENEITAVSPPGSGTVEVSVTTAGGPSPSSASDQFSYMLAPALTG